MKGFAGMLVEEDMELFRDNDMEHLLDQGMTWVDVTCHYCKKAGKATMTTTLMAAQGTPDDLGVNYICPRCMDARPEAMKEMIVVYDREMMSWIDQVKDEEVWRSMALHTAEVTLNGSLRIEANVDKNHPIFDRTIAVLLQILHDVAEKDVGVPETVREQSRVLSGALLGAIRSMTPGDALNTISSGAHHGRRQRREGE